MELVGTNQAEAMKIAEYARAMPKQRAAMECTPKDAMAKR